MLLRLKRRGYVPRPNEKILPAAGVSAKNVTMLTVFKIVFLCLVVMELLILIIENRIH